MMIRLDCSRKMPLTITKQRNGVDELSGNELNYPPLLTGTKQDLKKRTSQESNCKGKCAKYIIKFNRNRNPVIDLFIKMVQQTGRVILV